MTKQRFKFSSGMDTTITIDVDTTVMTPELASEVNAFWSGAEEVLDASDDQVRAVLSKLVATADMKTRLQALHEMGHGTDWDDWRRLDQEAWARARLLAAEA